MNQIYSIRPLVLFGNERILSAWQELQDPLQEIDICVFMYPTHKTFFFMTGGAKPSVESV